MRPHWMEGRILQGAAGDAPTGTHWGPYDGHCSSPLLRLKFDFIYLLGRTDRPGRREHFPVKPPEGAPQGPHFPKSEVPEQEAAVWTQVCTAMACPPGISV